MYTFEGMKFWFASQTTSIQGSFGIAALSSGHQTPSQSYTRWGFLISTSLDSCEDSNLEGVSTLITWTGWEIYHV